MNYCIDTSVILTAWRRDYPRDVFPSLWYNIESLIESRKLVAPEEVLVELERKDDEILKWAKQRRFMFIPVDVHIQQIVRNILRQFPRLLDTRRNRSGADPFVIGLATIERLTVVSGEARTDNLAKPNIPDVCRALKIPCIKLVDLAREQQWRL